MLVNERQMRGPCGVTHQKRSIILDHQQKLYKPGARHKVTDAVLAKCDSVDCLGGRIPDDASRVLLDLQVIEETLSCARET